MRKREKYINFATILMCSDDKTVNVYSSMVALVPHNECADGYVVFTRVIVHEKVHAPPPPFVKSEWIAQLRSTSYAKVPKLLKDRSFDIDLVLWNQNRCCHYASQWNLFQVYGLINSDFFQAGNVLSQLLEIWLDKVSKIITCRNLKCFHLTFFGGWLSVDFVVFIFIA